MAGVRLFDSSYGSRPHNNSVEVWQLSLNRNDCTLSGCCGFGHRIYAITEKNKWVGSSFFTMITAQLVFGIYATVVAAMSPSKFFDFFSFAGALMSISSATAAGHKPGSIQILRL